MKFKNIAVFTILFWVGISASKAQTDPKAKAILDAVSKKYKSFSAIKSDFSYVLDNPQENVKSYKQNGMILASPKTNKFHLTIYSGSGSSKSVEQEIISDGKTQWNFEKKTNEIQINDADNSSQSLNPAQVFTIYEKGYKYLFTGEIKQQGQVYQQIELTPVDNKKPFFKVRLLISKLKNQIYSATVYDKNGSRYTYILNGNASNYTGSDAVFGFNKKNYPGAEVVDLR